MQILLCEKHCVDAVAFFLAESNYYYAVVETSTPLSTFLHTFSAIPIKIVNRYSEGFLTAPTMEPIKNGEYKIAFFYQKIGLQSAAKIKMDLYMRRMFPQPKYEFLPIKNEKLFFKNYYYIFLAQSKKKKHEALLIYDDGYGDNILTLAFLSYYAKVKSGHGYQFSFYHFYTAGYHLSNIFTDTHKNFLYPLASDTPFSKMAGQNSELAPLKTSKLIHISNRMVDSAYTKIKTLSRILSFPEYPRFLENLSLNIPELPPHTKELMEQYRKRYKKLIGVQFYTYHDTNASVRRSWAPGLAQKFIDLCVKNHIGVINLSEYVGYEFHSVLNFSSLSICQLFPVVQQLDLFVGIDSCCSHIAGVLQKKNLTLLGKVLQGKSQRPLSNNISFISKSGDIDRIAPEELFRLACKVLAGQICPISYMPDAYSYDYDVYFC